jgi:hypothetical protein
VVRHRVPCAVAGLGDGAVLNLGPIVYGRSGRAGGAGAGPSRGPVPAAWPGPRASATAAASAPRLAAASHGGTHRQAGPDGPARGAAAELLR